MRVKRLMILTLMMLLIIAMTLTAFAYTFTDYPYYDAYSAVINSGGLYLVAFSGSDVHIEQAAPYTYSVDLHRNYPVAAASLFGDTAVILCNDTPNDQLIVYTYEMSTEIRDSFVISRYQVGYNRGFFYDGYSLYIRDEDDLSTINRFSTGGQLVSRYDFGSSDVQIISGYDGGFYVLADGALYHHSGDSYSLLSGARLHTPAAFISDSFITDSSGRIYRVDGGITEIFSAESDGSCAAAIAPDGSIYASVGNTIYRYDADTGRKAEYFEADHAIDMLYFCNGYLYALSDTSSPTVSRISPDEFIPLPDKEDHSSSRLPISSDLYTVDAVNYRITRIPSPTTFAQFKSNMYYDGYYAQLYRDGKNIKSGSVGTAMTVVFSATDTYTFELSVIGDITGEGNVNSRDVGELMDYFLGNIRFDGVYSDAADISADGNVDMLDLAMLCRMAK